MVVMEKSVEKHSLRPQALEKRRSVRIALFVVLGVVVVAASLWSIVVGQYTIPLRDLPGILAAGPAGAESMAEQVVWQIRMPRIVLGLLVGAALGVSGALLQAVFSNPLAEPSIIGVTSGAGVGAAAVIVFNITIFGTSTVAVGAFVTAVITTVLVYQLAKSRGRVQIINLILTGIAINAVSGALTSFFIYLAPTSSREEIIFWQMGSLNGSQWAHVNVVFVLVGVGFVLALLLSKQLDVLALGESAAGHVGLNVKRLRLLAIAASTLLTAGAVAYAGLISFVGLIIPHLLRTVTGPANKILVPASALAGAALISVSDILARTLVPYADLPIGIFTALVGGPTFFILLRRMMKKGTH
ncbi:ABC transporter permease [Corynebacterium deserti GIMN1.010]|uniref:ABC transporter permease n=1 Tax=Corynebacterium deserti GIMN1.010 TaxID=931089 RepID=A0A0M4CW02_9CORY|nr:iron ABC transporter permease [Corynebacterium deserti]ALC04895.1 ABC transporter permease [Corynebacterium deserti GIMN1.010]